MSDVLGEVVSDLAAEQAALAEMLDSLSAEEWERPTHAPGWAVRDQVAHLAHFDEAAALAMRDREAFIESARAANAADPSGVPDYLVEARKKTPADLLAWWREASSALTAQGKKLDPKARLPWYGPDMSAVSFLTARLMETWSHGLDIEDVVAFERPLTDRLKHVAFIGVRTRAFSYANRGREMPAAEVRVELTAPSGELWVFGDERATDRITGSALDFCQVVTQRRHPADTDLVVVGPAAQDWMEVAQAFAGPPGEGRKPGQFPKQAKR